MEIWQITGKKALLGIVGFSSGALVAGGVVALMVGLGIIRRFVGISHTAKQTGWYETAICLGGIWGNWMTVFLPAFPAGLIGLIVMGAFFGAFVGGWIMALAELLNVFPVFARRLGVVKGKSWIILGLAAGKMIGSLLGFYMRWGKN